MLEQSETAHYLLSLGLVKPRAILDEEIEVVDASRRNCVFIVAARDGPTYVVKQASPRHAATLEHEAAVLRFLAGAPQLTGLVPSLVHHDPAGARLVLRTPGGGRDWNEHHRTGRFARTAARILGRTLGILHRIPADGIEDLPAGVDRMWALSLPEPPVDLLLDLSEAAQELVGRLQAGERLCDRLRQLSETAADDALVHGDLRWDNCLMVAVPPSRRRTRLLLVDWELAGPGAAAFDVGAVLAEYLRVWLASIPMVEPSDLPRLLPQAGRPLHAMQPAVGAFWAAYRGSNPRSPRLRRVIDLAAVRLLQTAVEQARGLAEVSAQVMAAVQVADHMLRGPEYAALALLGLRE